MIKLGIADFDTSHVVEFTRRLHHRDVPEDQWVDGAQVVLGFPGASQIAPEVIAPHQKALEDLGVTMVNRPEDMIGRVDGILIESQEGGVHLKRAQPFLEAGIPCFIDKPMACSAADAARLASLAQKKKVAIFSSSSLRYAPELVEFMADDKHGKLHGAVAYGPAPVHDRNPGLLHYGIHPVEVLYTIMGPGCGRVVCMHEKDVDLVTGQWKDGRVGSVRGIRAGKADYGCVAFAERGVFNVAIGTRYIYRELLKRIVQMFVTGEAPLDVRTTVEIVSFMEAAWKSGNNHGAGQPL
jgi:predicted dehydrogenase